MTLIKLDSGNLLNLEAVAYVDAEKGQAYFKQPVIRRESDFSTEKLFAIKATAADINRIVEAMSGKCYATVDVKGIAKAVAEEAVKAGRNVRRRGGLA